ncbi:Zinc/iron permease [Trametopsis cervina]|nr:Zinc/iron permease [Trametopsis cervina]
MSGLLRLLLMATFLGLGSFAVGILPLLFVFSRTTLAYLSSIGTGLLLGTALGVIIPEGVETIAMTNTLRKFPSTTVALSLISGFAFMLLVEPIIHRVSSRSAHTTHHVLLPQSDASSQPDADTRTSISRNVVFDVELGELEQDESVTMDHVAPSSRNKDALPPASPVVAYPLTLGLMVHALADGLALGSSAVSPLDSSLSLVVFLALIVHKAPAVLALSTSLLSTSLSRSECQKHIAAFSAATPIGALFAYGLLVFARLNTEGNWTGIAMLISGGTFLYVATVLQPGKAAAAEIHERLRLVLVVLGMFIPVIISLLVGHEG